MSNEWLCIKDYERLYEKEGKEREIKSIPNVSGHLCMICGNLAEHLVSGFPNNLRNKGESNG